MPVPVVVVGELADTGPVRVHHKDLPVAVPVAHEGDLAVQTPEVRTFTTAPGQQHTSQQQPNEPSHTPQSATFP